MRNFELPGRSEAFGTNGMAATAHPQATLAALDVLKSGGNAVDAAITAAAVLAVVEPSQTGIGGDCFVLLKRRGQPVVALNGAGWAPAAASAEYYFEHGIEEIESTSVHSVTIPGAIRAWATLARDYGSRDWAYLLAPALNLAQGGYPVTDRLARDWHLQVSKLGRHEATSKAYLTDGKAPLPGAIQRQPALGNALASIAADGPDVFYEGWIAQDLVATLNSMGGLHSAEDFAEYRPHYVDPICASYHGYKLWECPPSGQGVVALAMARLLERFNFASLPPLSIERFHLQAEAARLSYAERDFHVCDPAFAPVPIEYLLSDRRAKQLSDRIDPSRRLADLNPVAGRPNQDTTYVSVVDRDRMSVSFINSIYDDFGSGIVSTKSGVLFHNRACGFTLAREHPNSIAGRKRPMHTIIPALLTKDDEAVMSFGVTGGHFQPLGQVNILSNIIDYGMSIQEAIDHPRIFARGDVFDFESTLPEGIVKGLRALGHNPTRAPNPIGTAQAIWIDQARGLFRGGADARRDGVALGI